ncbi:protogenin A-like [Eriocheir sinensis]|uniref:protogenin A-like n=1 Tax=Eriocheir sinensis TaxID=95602 RepID=UPI0021CAACF9|nr:protogenin A-like [Eriocheir sinensis]
MMTCQHGAVQAERRMHCEGCDEFVHAPISTVFVVSRGSSGSQRESVTHLKAHLGLHLVPPCRCMVPNGALHLTWVNARSRLTRASTSASLGVGTFISTRARLTIVEFDEQPQDVMVMEGERTGFPCALDTMPAPSIKGFRNSHPLEPDSRMTRLPSGALEIENVAMPGSTAAKPTRARCPSKPHSQSRKPTPCGTPSGPCSLLSQSPR